jgi:DHA1 family multidrug resistance protein-like MFS transporter
MKQILRSSTFGQAVRLISRGKVLQYREESPDLDFSEYFAKDAEKHTPEIKDLESGEDIESAQTPIRSPSATSNGPNNMITVGWYGDDDPENPHNWSNMKKYFVGLLIWSIKPAPVL